MPNTTVSAASITVPVGAATPYRTERVPVDGAEDAAARQQTQPHHQIQRGDAEIAYEVLNPQAAQEAFQQGRRKLAKGLRAGKGGWFPSP